MTLNSTPFNKLNSLVELKVDGGKLVILQMTLSKSISTMDVFQEKKVHEK